MKLGPQHRPVAQMPPTTIRRFTQQSMALSSSRMTASSLTAGSATPSGGTSVSAANNRAVTEILARWLDYVLPFLDHLDVVVIQLQPADIAVHVSWG